MPTFNRIELPTYTTIMSHNVLADGSIQIEYAVGVGEERENQVHDFQVLASQWFTIEKESATELLNQPMTKEDVGKTPNDILTKRCYDFLKANNYIKV